MCKYEGACTIVKKVKDYSKSRDYNLKKQRIILGILLGTACESLTRWRYLSGEVKLKFKGETLRGKRETKREGELETSLESVPYEATDF